MGPSPVKTSPKQSNNDGAVEQDSIVKPDLPSNAEASRPLASLPPPKPLLPSTNSPDYFSSQIGGSLSLEPNPFEQSFGGAPAETPGGTKLPSVASLTSPTSLIPGTGVTPFTWGGGSLRTGPLSPAMLSGPANDYFSDTHHIRGGFPTPNESSLRTGLTPGGSGSMFPAPSPNSQALFAQLASGGATPSTLDFHRTALSAAAKRDHPLNSQTAQALPLPQLQNQSSLQSQALPPPPPQPQQQQQLAQQQQQPNGLKNDIKSGPGPFDPHANDAANGLFLLAQGRNGSQNTNQFAVPPDTAAAHPRTLPPTSTVMGSSMSPQMASIDSGASLVGSSARQPSGPSGPSEAGSAVSDESERPKAMTRTRTKRATQQANTGRRKADDTPSKPPPRKKGKSGSAVSASVLPPPSISGSISDQSDEHEHEHEQGGKRNESGSKTKLTDDEKRRNFLERNRVAALKCRQRKKQWLQNLQTKVEMFSTENDALTQQIAQLREEVVNLKTLLLAHRDCPVTQQQGLHSAFMSQVSEPFNPQVNAFGITSGIPNQPVIAGPGVQRRFS